MAASGLLRWDEAFLDGSLASAKKCSAGRIRFFGSGTNAEKIAAAASGRIPSPPGEQNGNPGENGSGCASVCGEKVRGTSGRVGAPAC